MLQTSVRGEWDIAQEEITTKRKKRVSQNLFLQEFGQELNPIYVSDSSIT